MKIIGSIIALIITSNIYAQTNAIFLQTGINTILKNDVGMFGAVTQPSFLFSYSRKIAINNNLNFKVESQLSYSTSSFNNDISDNRIGSQRTYFNYNINFLQFNLPATIAIAGKALNKKKIAINIGFGPTYILQSSRNVHFINSSTMHVSADSTVFKNDNFEMANKLGFIGVLNIERKISFSKHNFLVRLSSQFETADKEYTALENGYKQSLRFGQVFFLAGIGHNF